MCLSLAYAVQSAIRLYINIACVAYVATAVAVAIEPAIGKVQAVTSRNSPRRPAIADIATAAPATAAAAASVAAVLHMRGLWKSFAMVVQRVILTVYLHAVDLLNEQLQLLVSRPGVRLLDKLE